MHRDKAAQEYRERQKQKHLDATFADLSKKFEKKVLLGGHGKGSGEDQLHEPWALFIDADRFVYVSDHKNHRVIRFHADVQGVRQVVAGGNGKGFNKWQLCFPTGIFVDMDGSLFIADFGNNRIMKWPRGAEEGLVVAQIQAPRSIFLDKDFTMHISTLAYNHAVMRLSPFYKGLHVERGGTKKKKRNVVWSFFVKSPPAAAETSAQQDQNERAFGSVASNDSTTSVLPDAVEEVVEDTSWSDSLVFPEQVLVDGGDIIVADSGNHCISKLNPSKGQKQPTMLVQGSNKFMPASFAIDSAKGVYCTDDAKRKIVRHGGDKTMQIIFQGGAGDFFNRGIALDNRGNVYACNWGRNHEVVKISEIGKTDPPPSSGLTGLTAIQSQGVSSTEVEVGSRESTATWLDPLSAFTELNGSQQS